MTVHCVFIKVSVGQSGDGSILQLLDVCATEEIAEIVASQYHGPTVEIVIEAHEVIEETGLVKQDES